MADDKQPPAQTPWGDKDHQFEEIPGFWWVSTPRHGGLYLNVEQCEAIPENLKARSADGKGIWWEEDCAWSLPIVYLLSKRSESLSAPEEELLGRAHLTAREYYPDEWENLTGRKIEPGQSDRRDSENRLIELRDNLVVSTAWGASRENPWIPEGMVGVAAFPGKEFLNETGDPERTAKARYFLIPENEYEAGDFVVDPSRHQEVKHQKPKVWETGREQAQDERPEQKELKFRTAEPGRDQSRGR